MSNTQSKPAPSRALIGFAFLAFVGIAFAAGWVLQQRTSEPTPQTGDERVRYGLVIDAGSSGSRLHIYEWKPASKDDVPWVRAAPSPRELEDPPWVKKVEPGLSAYADKPREAGESLAPLIDYARQQLDTVKGDIGDVPIWVMATAGMRLVPEPQKGQILDDVREYLGTTSFKTKAVEVITGVQEGVFGWVTTNYLMGYFGTRGAFPNAGALDLGGASTQITFVSLDVPEKRGRTTFRLGGVDYQIYSHSYLGLGQDEARANVNSTDGFPVGYPMAGGRIGTGNFDACRKTIRAWLKKPCEKAPCSLMGMYQPPVSGQFLAFSGYYYTQTFFDLGSSVDLPALSAAATKFLATSWDDLRKQYPDQPEKYLANYGFNAAYIVTLLADGYGFPMQTRDIITTGRLQGAEMGWTLGAMVKHVVDLDVLAPALK